MTSRLKEVTSFRNNINSITLAELGGNYTQRIPIQFSLWKFHAKRQLFEHRTANDELIYTEIYEYQAIKKSKSNYVSMYQYNLLCYNVKTQSGICVPFVRRNMRVGQRISSW